ncbi:MAG: hypothetical protein EHM55_05625 [Acidobacteria bacterium]|nr:MAG: hypothetical protein EHM55_05625 [Acidobacteriota bacterium]
MRFCLLVALTLLLGNCSGQGVASQDPNAPVKILISQMYVTVKNESGLALNDVEIAIIPIGRTTVFNKFLGRIENAESRNVMLGDFIGRDGTPFNLRAIKPRSVEVKGKDVKGQEHTAEVPWQ